MSFIAKAEAVARAAMPAGTDEKLVEKYVLLVRFMAEFPTVAAKLRGKNAPGVGSDQYVRDKQVRSSNQDFRKPQKPPTQCLMEWFP